jgi:hypothetical protein
LTAVGFSIAILSRTNALMTFLGYLGFLILQRRLHWRGGLNIVIDLIPLVVAGLVWAGIFADAPFQGGLVQKIFLKDLYTAFTTKLFLPFLWSRITALALWAGYLGAILLPVTFWLFIRSAPKWKGGEEARIEPRQARLIWLVLLPLLLVTAAVLMYAEPRNLVIPNTITEYGLGVKGDILPGARRLLGADFFSILKLFICVGGMLLGLGAMGRVLEKVDSRGGRGLLWWLAISTAVFPLLTDIFSDRYLLPLLPLLFVLITGGADSGKRMPRWLWVFPIALVAGTGLLANEYFGWNTARWKAIPLPEGHIAKPFDGEYTDVDGGLEYTAFRYYSDAEFMKGIEVRLGGEEELSPDELPGMYPWYVYSLFLPKEYDIIVREDAGHPPIAAGPVFEGEWDMVRRVEYRPFPWASPRGIAAYSRKVD